MPTARELLEQADALMRRNRVSDAAAAEIPELTDEVPLVAQEARGSGSPRPARAAVLASRRGEPATDVPELTDAVAYVDAVSIQPLAEEGGEVSRWLEAELGDASITGPAPDSIAVVPPATLRAPAGAATTQAPRADSASISGTMVQTPGASPPSAAAALAAKVSGEFSQPPPAYAPLGDYAFEAMLAPPPDSSSAPLSAEAAFDQELDNAPSAGVEHAVEAELPVPPDELAAPIDVGTPEIAAQPADDALRWAALAEEIRMQVLQRIDIFTDTGLQQQLTARLQPIVDRASADLVAAINQHVGTLLRGYIAEAIEREIEKYRQEGR